jgi:HSP20 family protein
MAYYITNPMPRLSRRMMQQLFDESVEQERSVYFPVDVKADDSSFEISAILPGVDHEEINISIADEIVTIEGEFKNNREEEATYYLAERPFGPFKRALNLNVPLDAENAQAELKNGILVLRVPKAKEAMPKSIKVSAK